MLWPARNHPWKLRAHRLCAVVALLSYLATISGLPLPSGQGKDRSKPFPCQDHPCGCRTAEECWRHCCCFTPEAKWIWAQVHHVEPPSYAEVAPPKGWQTVRLRDQAECGGTACRSCSVAPEKPAAGTATSCCAPRSSPASCTHTPTRSCDKQQPPRKGELRWTHGISLLRCQGLSTLWVSAGAVLTPPPGPTWNAPTNLSGIVSDRDASPVTIPHTPLPPPPRFVAV